jgi:hypothetical protein
MMPGGRKRRRGENEGILLVYGFSLACEEGGPPEYLLGKAHTLAVYPRCLKTLREPRKQMREKRTENLPFLLVSKVVLLSGPSRKLSLHII